MIDNRFEKSKKRILAIVGAIPCRNNVYAGIFTMNQFIELSKSGRYKIDVIFLRPMFPKVMNWIGPRLRKNIFVLDRPIGTTREDIKIHLIPYPHLPKLSTFIIVIAAFCYILFKGLKFDIIHAYYLFFPGYLGIMLGNYYKKPVVVTAMGSDVNLLYGKSTYGISVRPDMTEKLMITLKKAKVIIAKGDYLKKRITDVGISENKVIVINNGVSKEKFHLLHRRDITTKKKTILYVGNLYVQKGLIELLEAVESLGRKRDDFSLIMIGTGPSKKKLLELIGRLKIEEFVVMEGQKNHEEIPKWINKSHVVCLPSYSEGFPNVVVESITCGRPVVASNIGGIPEIINDSRLGILVPPGNTEKLARALDEALDKEWGREMIARSGTRFHWENILPKFNELYSGLS